MCRHNVPPQCGMRVRLKLKPIVCQLHLHSTMSSVAIILFSLYQPDSTSLRVEREEGDVAVDFIGKPNGTIEFWVPDAGRLFAKLRVTPTRSDRPPMQGASNRNGQSSFLFPRIPAMATTLVLDLPENVVPLIVGNEATTRQDPLHDVGFGELTRWKYLIGPRQLLNVALLL